MKFSYKLQELRKGSGMSQEEFAELLGVSRQSVSKWESGKGYPEIDKLIFISNYFNTSLDLLLKDTTDYDSNPSLDTSVSKSTSRKRKSKAKVNLTKPEVEPTETTFMSDPMPQKKVRYPLRQVSVSSNAQVRPTKSYTFGKHPTKKLNLKRVALACVPLIVGVVGILGIVGLFNSNTAYYEEDTGVIEGTYYDEYVIEDYGSSWEEFFDDDAELSGMEEELYNSNNQQERIKLVDEDGRVYYSGWDTITMYEEMFSNMRYELNCVDLYNQYTDMESYTNQQFLEVYCYDLEEWLVINKCMLRVSPSYEEEDTTTTKPIHELATYDDILSTNYKEWESWNNTPYQNVYRVTIDADAIVSSDILDLCVSATCLRKSNQDMSQYVKNYENYLRKFALVQYDDNYAFVPKEFLLINASQYNAEEIDDEEILEDREAIEEAILYNDAIIDEDDLDE